MLGAVAETLHMLVRTDDNGARTMVRSGLDAAAAEAAVREMTARGHKQTFESVPYEPGRRHDTAAALGIAE